MFKQVEKLPENQKLCPKDHKMVVDALKLGCNKKLLQEKLALESNKRVTLKDLKNIQSSLKNEDDNTLKKAVQLLEKKGMTDFSNFLPIPTGIVPCGFSIPMLTRFM